MSTEGFDFGKLFQAFFPRKRGNYREYAFLALGFQYRHSVLKNWIKLALDQGEALACREGVYYRLADVSNAEFWVRTSLMGQVGGVDVFYNGKSSIPFGLQERLPSASGDLLEGGFYGESNTWQVNEADLENPFLGDFPVAFTVPDYARLSNLALPALRLVRMTAFAKGLSAFVDESDFRLRSHLRVASQSFFPAAELQAWSTFSGKVLETAVLKNELTGQDFCWALVEAYGAILDVVVNPRTLRGTLVPDGYVLGHCWLMGRVDMERSESERRLGVRSKSLDK